MNDASLRLPLLLGPFLKPKVMNYIKVFIQNIKSVDYGKAFKTFLPFLIAVLSGITTFFLYSYFNRDIVRIQSVAVRPKEIVLTIDRQLANKLSRLLSESSIERIQSGNLDLSSINKDYIIESIKILQRRSSDLSDKIQQQTTAKNQLNELKIDSLGKDDIDKISSLENTYYYDYDDEIRFSGSSSVKRRKDQRNL